MIWYFGSFVFILRGKKILNNFSLNGNTMDSLISKSHLTVAIEDNDLTVYTYFKNLIFLEPILISEKYSPFISHDCFHQICVDLNN